MRVRRHFNLARIGHQYDSIEIEVERSTIDEAITEIQKAWEAYCQAITKGGFT